MREFFRDYIKERTPVRFTYGGREAEFGELREVKALSGEAYTAYEKELRDERFAATLHVRRYASAVEWWLTLEAPGEYDSEIVSELSYCGLRLELEKVNGAVSSRYPCVYYNNGSHAALDDFMPFERSFWPYMKEPMHFCCDGGRSSSGCMPYFNLQTEAKAGVILAIGWSGQWHMYMNRVDEADKSILLIDAQMEEAYFRVESGEKLELPHMLAYTWEGEVQASYNGFRAWQLTQAPKVNGKTVEAPISLTSWGGSPSRVHLENIGIAKKYGFEADTYWIDAGWFGDGDERSEDDFRDTWYYNVGAWKTLEHLYPRGFEEIAEALEGTGMGLLLWFEMERANSRLSIVREHREYFIGAKLPFTAEDNFETGRTRYSLMLNLGYEPARRYITEVLAEYIEKARLKVLRIDFNYEPLAYWQNNDGPERRGISEIKYNAGIYALMDELRERFPRLVIDNCASGGRRLDYQFLRRALPFTRTDYLCVPDRRDACIQMQTYGISRWLPISGNFAGNVRSTEGRTNNFRSHHAAAIGLDALSYWAGEGEEYFLWCQKMFSEAKRVREIICHDFYPLTGCSISEKDWFAYQSDDKAAGKGFILAFRRSEAAQGTMLFELYGIDENAIYALDDGDTGERWSVCGKELRTLKVDIADKGQSRIIFYQKKSSEVACE